MEGAYGMAFILDAIGCGLVGLRDLAKQAQRDLQAGEERRRKIELRPPQEVPPAKELASKEELLEALPTFREWTGLAEHTPVLEAFWSAGDNWQSRLGSSPQDARKRVFESLSFCIREALPRYRTILNRIDTLEIPQEELPFELSPYEELRDTIKNAFCRAVQTFELDGEISPIQLHEFGRETLETLGLDVGVPAGFMNFSHTDFGVTPHNNCWMISLLQVLFNNDVLKEHLIEKLPEARFTDMPKHFLDALPEAVANGLPEVSALDLTVEERTATARTILQNLPLPNLQELIRKARELTSLESDAALLEGLLTLETLEDVHAALFNEADEHQLFAQVKNALYSTIPNYTIFKQMLHHYEVERAAGRKVSIISAQKARQTLAERSMISIAAKDQEDATEALNILMNELTAVATPHGEGVDLTRHPVSNPLFSLTRHTKRFGVPEGAAVADEDAERIDSGVLEMGSLEILPRASVSLPDIPKISFEDLLEDFFKPPHAFTDEPLTSGEATLPKLEETRTYIEPPEILAVDVKRFEHVRSRSMFGARHSMYKKMGHIDVPKEYFLKREHVENNHAAKYELTNFIVHIGAYGGGHYVSYNKLEDGKWYICNDDKVSEVTESVALKAAESAYSIFFTKVDEYPEGMALPEEAPSIEDRRVPVKLPHDYPSLPPRRQADTLFAIGRQFLSNPTKESLEVFPLSVRQKLAEISWIERGRSEESEEERLQYIAENPSSLLEIRTPYYSATDGNIVEQLIRRTILNAHCDTERVREEDTKVYDKRGELSESDREYLSTLLINPKVFDILELERKESSKAVIEKTEAIAYKAFAIMAQLEKGDTIIEAEITPEEAAILRVAQEFRKQQAFIARVKDVERGETPSSIDAEEGLDTREKRSKSL